MPAQKRHNPLLPRAKPRLNPPTGTAGRGALVLPPPQKANALALGYNKITEGMFKMRLASKSTNKELEELGGRFDEKTKQLRELRSPLSQAHALVGLLGGSSVLLAARVGALDSRFFDFQVTLRKLSVNVGQAIHQSFAPFYGVLESVRGAITDADGNLGGFGGTALKAGIVTVALAVGLKSLGYLLSLVGLNFGKAALRAQVFAARLRAVGVASRFAMAGGILGAFALPALLLGGGIAGATLLGGGGGAGGERGGQQGFNTVPARSGARSGGGTTVINNVYQTNNMAVGNQHELDEYINDGLRRGKYDLGG